MAIPVLEFYRKEYKVRKVFGQKSTVVEWNYQILIIGVMASCQMLGTILENEVIYELILSKNVNKNQKDSDDFW